MPEHLQLTERHSLQAGKLQLPPDIRIRISRAWIDGRRVGLTYMYHDTDTLAKHVTTAQTLAVGTSRNPYVNLAMTSAFLAGVAEAMSPHRERIPRTNKTLMMKYYVLTQAVLTEVILNVCCSAIDCIARLDKNHNQGYAIPAKDRESWHGMFNGALGTAGLAKSLITYGYKVYTPTVFEDMNLGIDLIAWDGNRKRGFAFGIKSSRAAKQSSITRFQKPVVTSPHGKQMPLAGRDKDIWNRLKPDEQFAQCVWGPFSEFMDDDWDPIHAVVKLKRSPKDKGPCIPNVDEAVTTL